MEAMPEASWWASRDGRYRHLVDQVAEARAEDPHAHHRWVYCTVCDKAYVTRRGAIGCSCGRVTLIPITTAAGEELCKLQRFLVGIRKSV